MSGPDVPGRRPAVTSWFLLALTALAALLGSGLEVGGPGGVAAREVAAAPAGTSQQSTEATDARVPFVGAVLTSSGPGAAAPLDPAAGGTPAVVAAPLGVLEQAPAQAAAPSYVVIGGSGRAPPVTSGT